MSWQDRLREYVKFVSPSGQEFTPLWKGNDISAEKRLGRHAYPNIDKEVIQDLGMNSREIPFTIYFDGPEHDKLGRSFEQALYEPEDWQVTHPVYGLLNLQLVSYKLSVEPVENGNITAFETQWIEPANDEEINALADPAVEVEAAVQAVNETTITDMGAVTQKTVSESKVAANSVKQGITSVKGAIKSANAKILATQNKINELIASVYLDIAEISGGVIELIEAPGLMLGAISSKVAMFATLGKNIIGKLFPSDSAAIATSTTTATSINHTNSALVGQLFLNTITAAIGLSVISEPMGTRREALTVLREYQNFTHEAQFALDRAVSVTANNHIEKQFVSRAHSGEAIATLNTVVARYLLTSLFDLKIEKQITLDRPRAALEIAITEYDASAENADYFYEQFCRTNDLHGRELLLLPSGREVVIYA